MSTGIPALDLAQQSGRENSSNQSAHRRNLQEQDEFAGLMNQRERQWVINIQLNQVCIHFSQLKNFLFLKRGSLLENEEPHLGGDSPIFEIIYSNLEQRSIFSKKSTHFYVRIKIGLK